MDNVNPAIDEGRAAADDPEIPDDLRAALRRIVLVGEDNPQSSRPDDALVPWPDNCAGHRLMRILGLPEELYLLIQRTNLCCPRWNAANATSRAVDLLMARADGVEWEPFPTPHVIIALGAKVSERFSIAHRNIVCAEEGTDPRHVKPRELAPFDIRRCSEAGELPVTLGALGSIPHPSGRNQFWNSPTNHMRARAFMRELAPRVPWGTSL